MANTKKQVPQFRSEEEERRFGLSMIPLNSLIGKPPRGAGFRT